jgi:hypothetical protein
MSYWLAGAQRVENRDIQNRSAHSSSPSRTQRTGKTPNSLLCSAKLALPDDFHPKSQPEQCSRLFQISLSVGKDLCFPPFTIRSREARELATTVTVPEAAVNEDAPFSCLVCDVGAPREILWASSKAQTLCVKELA